MASRSTTRESELEEYENAWAALTQLMDSGSSWSGNERNCSFVNVGDGTFCDVSALSGFDYLDDGRAVVTTDWDGDGRLDLWLRNRTGPQLRLMRNAGRGAHHFVSLALRGVSCNRDAIGARVEAVFGGRRVVRSLHAGSGYLAQSSKWVTLGLGSADASTLERLVVTWPGGERQEFSEVEVDRFYRVEQGAAELEAFERDALRLRPGPVEVPPAGSARVVLRRRLPFPPDVWRELFGDAGDPGQRGPSWIQLWAQWCAPCQVEMDALVQRWSELGATGLRLVALTLDDAEDLERAREVFQERVGSKLDDPHFTYAEPSPQIRTFLQVLLEHVLARAEEGALPTGLLIDRHGYLQLLVVGPAEVDRMLEDLRTFGRGEGYGVRSVFPGRWFFGTPRDLAGLAARLESEGLEAQAEFYRRLAAREAARGR